MDKQGGVHSQIKQTNKRTHDDDDVLYMQTQGL